MTSCDNCGVALPAKGSPDALRPPWRLPFPIGPDRGTQRDPVTATLDLCGDCQDTLGGRIGGPATPVDLAAFHARGRAKR